MWCRWGPFRGTAIKQRDGGSAHLLRVPQIGTGRVFSADEVDHPRPLGKPEINSRDSSVIETVVSLLPPGHVTCP
jgi:hypothetical protein